MYNKLLADVEHALKRIGKPKGIGVPNLVTDISKYYRAFKRLNTYGQNRIFVVEFRDMGKIYLTVDTLQDANDIATTQYGGYEVIGIREILTKHLYK